MDLSLFTFGRIFEVYIELRDTNSDASTPAAVPVNEKRTSPWMPMTNPAITISRVEHVNTLVDLPSTKYVSITLNTMDRHRATLSVIRN